MGIIEQVRLLKSQGMSYRAIAIELNTSPTKVGNILNGRMAKYRSEPTTADKVRKLRLKGYLIKEIASKLKIDRSTVSKYIVNLPKVSVPRKGKVGKVLELTKLGKTAHEISLMTGIAKATVYKYSHDLGVKVNRKIPVGEKRALCICLRMDGYSNKQIVDISGLSMSSVKDYVKGVKAPVKQKVKVMPKKKKVKSSPSALDQRAVLGKGVERGVYDLKSTLNPNRDEGFLLGISYKDYGGSIKKVQIRVNDLQDKESRAKKWCDKFKKEYVNCF